MQDVVIIGSGPAGLSAALYMLRGGFSTTVIGKDNGALEKAEKIENYFGLERPLSGHELIENGRTQVQRLGGTLLQDEVVGISWNRNYLISTASTQIEARAIILTTGTSRKTMKIKNLTQLEGHGVSYCAVCDAFLYRGESVAVLGNGEYALHEVQELLPIVDSVTLLTNGLEPSVDFPPEVTIIQTPVLQPDAVCRPAVRRFDPSRCPPLPARMPGCRTSDRRRCTVPAGAVPGGRQSVPESARRMEPRRVRPDFRRRERVR